MRKLTSHAAAEKVQASDSGCDEEETEQEADEAAAVQRRHDEQRDADRDERKTEDRRARPEEGVHAAARAATTSTRHGACLST